MLTPYLAPVDSVEYARSVREDTADLAKYWLSDAKENNSRVLLTRSRSYSSQIGRDAPMTAANDREERAQEDGQLHSDILSNASDVIVELPEPTSPIHAETATAGADYHLRDARGYDDEEQEDDHHSPSLLSTMLKRSPPKSFQKSHLQSSSQVDIEREDQVESSRMRPQRGRSHPRGGSAVSSRSRTPTLHRVRQGEAWEGEPRELPDEFTPLLAVQSPCEPDGGEYETNALATNGYHVPAREHQQYDVESQKIVQPLRRYRGIMDRPRTFADSVAGAMTAFIDPKKWSRKALFENCVVAPLACIPAVVVGTLLNILDALSYGESRPGGRGTLFSSVTELLLMTPLGMILFPLGNPIFANLGSAGISIFYVSTIISQLVFSTGSIFKGGLGSQLVGLCSRFVANRRHIKVRRS